MRALLFAFAVSLAFAGCDQLDFIYPKNESATRDNLEALRGKISDSMPGNGGKYPSRFKDLVANPQAAETGHHFRNDQVIEACTDGKDPSRLQDTGGWAYCSNPKDDNFGRFVVDCTHNDSTGKPWFSY